MSHYTPIKRMLGLNGLNLDKIIWGKNFQPNIEISQDFFLIWHAINFAGSFWPNILKPNVWFCGLDGRYFNNEKI